MPSAGYRNGSNFNNGGNNGYYWSSGANDNNGNNAYCLNFNSGNVNPQNNNNRYNGLSVRLVQRQSQDPLLTELYLSYLSARSNKRNTQSQVRFERNLVANLLALYHDIVSGRYCVGRSMCFIVERPVKREIFAASFRDRIVHHLLFRWLSPVFEPLFIHDAYSCRTGKGTLFGINRLEHHIRSVSRNYTEPCWILRLDIEGYFMHIDRARLYDIISSVLRAKGLHRESRFKTMDFLLRQVVFNDPTRNCYVKGSRSDWSGLPDSKSLFHAREGCGLPIGNLTSQLFSNIYLNEFDQFVKRELKCRHYGRYVDDFYVVSPDRRWLLGLIPGMSDFLSRNLLLRIHPRKIFLQRQESGIPFLGVVLKSGRRYMQHGTRCRMQEHMAEMFAQVEDPYRIRAAMNSYRGLVGERQ